MKFPSFMWPRHFLNEQELQKNSYFNLKPRPLLWTDEKGPEVPENWQNYLTIHSEIVSERSECEETGFYSLPTSPTPLPYNVVDITRG